MTASSTSPNDGSAPALPPRYIFTVSTGRAGQNTLADFLSAHVIGATVAFEEPNFKPVLPSVLGVAERKFRRRFIETHELLGRGKVLDAFAAGDQAALQRFGRDKLAWMERRMAKTGARVFIDVSKHFVHGHHVQLTKDVPFFGLMLLTRDPVENMRSYLNRGKDFYLDNNRPDCKFNVLVLPTEELSPGELYLWAWFETQLRYRALTRQFPQAPTFELTTPELNDPATLERLMDRFGLQHGPVNVIGAKNTNRSRGYADTRIQAQDIATFEHFVARVPDDLLQQIPLLSGYRPRQTHAMALAS